MCGFTGFYSETIDKRKTIIKEMNDKIIHRGPDSEGYYCDEYVAFGFRRLSFVDVEKGSQPIHSKDKSKVIMFNGEIYNLGLNRLEFWIVVLGIIVLLFVDYLHYKGERL